MNFFQGRVEARAQTMASEREVSGNLRAGPTAFMFKLDSSIWNQSWNAWTGHFGPENEFCFGWRGS